MIFLIILWRYCGKSDVDWMIKKERYALTALGVLFFISAAIVEYESIQNIALVIKPKPSNGFIIINMIQGVLFLYIGIYKFKLSKKVKTSSSLVSDSVNSVISSFDCFSMSFSMTLFVLYPTVWYMDSVFGIIMGIFIFTYGCSLFFQLIFLKSFL